MFCERTIPEIVLELVSIKAEQLRSTGYGKQMPYVSQELSGIHHPGHQELDAGACQRRRSLQKSDCR